MEAAYTAWLAACAFILGAIPFSVVIGHLLLKKDITKYGDGNPGSANVFRAGNVWVGLMAVVLDIAKGVPFVWLAHAVFGLPPASIVIIAVAAVLGHAFSPFLRWHGGKAVAITFGVMLGLPQYDVLLAFIIAMILCLIFVKIDAWKIIIGASGTLAYLAIVKSFVNHGLDHRKLFINGTSCLSVTCLLNLIVLQVNRLDLPNNDIA